MQRKNLASQSKDVIDAAKGKKRKGRKPKVKMPKPTNMGGFKIVIINKKLFNYEFNTKENYDFQKLI